MLPLSFALAILLLLATPGPTNTLLWLSGAAVGMRRSLPLLLGELGGYLTVIAPVAVLAAALLSAHPEIGLLLKLAAACWILFMAHALWTRKAHSASERPIASGQVLATTLLNPKALVIALVIMPQHGLLAMLPWFLGLAALTLSAGTLWIAAGSLLARLPRRPVGPRLPRRIAAACLVAFSFGIAGSALASML
ncbi:MULTISPECIES: LysE family transporter [Sinorhizobium]|uniref:Threonine transporter RhtB n=1 Tax=Sinorhizobium americanum TaxID=194963 RepID=A0A2S3YLA7_9HYPH|nr:MULTISPECIES: LysE family transporter [Sinorhizobium]PDT41965.1 threonine transporter RhtB [Sinorhizobium sp. FG01]PDT53944.1 threonine transporter RhtB [Sinorhizobium sp. NG07B]POH28776.1 threonine transporter RhtB [Sinorhizobium americanum]POH31003.1 threonine transporter RhtB [Sinorhizobium americanum]